MGKHRYHVVVDGKLYSIERNIELPDLLFRLESEDFCDDIFEHSVRVFKHTDSGMNNGEHVAVSRRNSFEFEEGLDLEGR